MSWDYSDTTNIISDFIESHPNENAEIVESINKEAWMKHMLIT